MILTFFDILFSAFLRPQSEFDLRLSWSCTFFPGKVARILNILDVPSSCHFWFTLNHFFVFAPGLVRYAGLSYCLTLKYTEWWSSKRLSRETTVGCLSMISNCKKSPKSFSCWTIPCILEVSNFIVVLLTLNNLFSSPYILNCFSSWDTYFNVQMPVKHFWKSEAVRNNSCTVNSSS